ncbi:MAG TPA: DUF5663 domain-containing protein [Candidatus Saccharimonadales bacterium]|jgi:hypothetical protein
MALKLDNNLLEELGLGALPDSEKQLLLRQIYEKLEMNVGMRLADQMSNEQLDAFEKFVDASDDKGAFQWLEQNFPNYKMVVNEEFEKLKAEVRSVAPQILASAQQQEGAAQAAAGPGTPQAGQMPASGPSPAQAAPQQYSPGPQPQPGQQPQPQYYQQSQPQYAPAPGTAIPQNGHLQPQYGAPAPNANPAQQYPPQQAGQQSYPPEQPPQQPPAAFTQA